MKALLLPAVKRHRPGQTRPHAQRRAASTLVLDETVDPSQISGRGGSQAAYLDYPIERRRASRTVSCPWVSDVQSSGRGALQLLPTYAFRLIPINCGHLLRPQGAKNLGDMQWSFHETNLGTVLNWAAVDDSHTHTPLCCSQRVFSRLVVRLMCLMSL